jgi:HAD superfamily hydrolase (TIGR01459 family)
MSKYDSPLTSLSAIAHSYDVVLCDVWGVIHDGVRVHSQAREALERFRNSGGSVVLLSNASRLSTTVRPELERLGMITAGYDALVTSGDISRDFLSTRPGISVFDLGPGGAHSISEELDVKFTGIEDADIAVSAGAFHEDESIDERRPQLQAMRDRQLLLLCANPDVVTVIGGRRVKCSGALAEIYADMGGPVLYAGKPHAAIFERAMDVVSELRGASVPRDRILVIGDSIRTDIAGARRNGLDSLFVASGIHAQQLGCQEPLDLGALERLFGETGLTPTAVTWRLSW